MSEFFDMQEEGLDSSNDIMGEDFSYLGITYKGIISEIELENRLQEGGLFQKAAASIVVPKSVMLVVPAIGKTITISGKKFKLAKIQSDSTSYNLTLETFGGVQ